MYEARGECDGCPSINHKAQMPPAANNDGITTKILERDFGVFRHHWDTYRKAHVLLFSVIGAMITVWVSGIGIMVVAGEAQTSISTVASRDGTAIAIECAGAGPSLVIVHGGTGDRSRWTPLFPLLAPQFRVCAMDRRAHGASGDSPAYSLQKEVEDVVAVVEAQAGPVFVLGHSFGAVCAFEAAFQTAKIARLVRSTSLRCVSAITRQHWRAWRP